MAAQSFDMAVKEFKKEQAAWRREKASLERQNLQLNAKNEALRVQNQQLESQRDKVMQRTAAVEARCKEVQAEVSRLEAQQDALETKVADKVTELADIRATVIKRKHSIDTELATYALERKQAIKADILAVNDDLQMAKTMLIEVQSLVDERTTELTALNQATIDLQDDIKILKADKQVVLVDTMAEIKRVKQGLLDLQADYDKLGFQYNNALITIRKAEDQNKQFREYEQQARKVLDAKDKELQEREADIAQESVFLKNRRSNLPAM